LVADFWANKVRVMNAIKSVANIFFMAQYFLNNGSKSIALALKHITGYPQINFLY
jgi:hypothetical protein